MLSCIKRLGRYKQESYRTMVESLLRIISLKRRNVIEWERANILQHMRFDFWLWSREYRNVAYLIQDTALLFKTDEPTDFEELGEGAITHFVKILGYLHAVARKEWGLRDFAADICQKATSCIPYELHM